MESSCITEIFKLLYLEQLLIILKIIAIAEINMTLHSLICVSYIQSQIKLQYFAVISIFIKSIHGGKIKTRGLLLGNRSADYFRYHLKYESPLIQPV